MENILEEIDKIKDREYLIIAEGKNDKKALEIFGLRRIMFLENRPLYEVIEAVDEKDVVILTDLDVEGRKLFNKLRNGLQKRGIRIHNQLRNLLFKSKLRQIEGLKSYLKEEL